MRNLSAQPGGVALGMLAGKWTVAVLGELGEEPLRLVELERVLPQAAHGTLSARLRELASHGIVEHERVHDSAVHVECRLTERGHELSEIVADAALLERELPSAPRARGAPGERIVRWLADPYTRAIRRALANGPLSPAEIERSQLGLAHSTVLRRANRLARAGLLISSGRSGARRYELVDTCRRLARIVVRASLCERRWAGADAPVQSDIRGLVHMIAPIARPPSGLTGACRLQVRGDPGEAAIDIALGRGRLLAHAVAPTVTIDAHGRADSEEWGWALLHGDLGRIEVEGDHALLKAVVVALGTAISL